jgi:Ca2+-binding RTX toxin-like protein
MSVIKVGSAAALERALSSARNGDVIMLESGTYSGIDIRGANFSNVTIQSANPLKPAVLTGLVVRDSSGLDFKDLELVIAPNDAVRAFQILGSKDISLDRLNVHGTLGRNPGDESSGLMIRNSSDISVTRSEFHHLRHGIEILDSKKLVLTGNSFHDLRTDGIRGGGASDVLVSKNHFTNFFPAAGDHGDAVQFWTTNTTASAKNIMITENLFNRGSGGIVQGIFLRDQLDSLPFENVTIANNIVIGAMYNGIAVDGAKNLKITGNTVVALPDMKSWIRVEKTSQATVTGNQAAEFVYIDSVGVKESGNQKNARAHDGGQAALQGWMAKFGASFRDVGQPEAPTGSPVKAAAKASVAGREGNDTLRSTQDTDGTSLEGRGGDDILLGGKHADIFIGGAGNDQLTGGGGADQFRFFGTQIEGKSDTDTVRDLSFVEGDTLVFGDFGPNTFADAAGVNAHDGGSAASISSFKGIVTAAAASTKVTAYRQGPGSGNLVLDVTDADGQVQKVVIVGGYAQYLAAGGSDGL